MNDFGYGQYASSNDLILIYPQQKWEWYNIINCMDFRGHTTLWTDKYMTKEGPQMKALKAMIDRVTSTRDSEKWDYLATNENIYTEPFIEKYWWGPYLFFKNMPEFLINFSVVWSWVILAYIF